MTQHQQSFFSRFSHVVAHTAGRPLTFVLALTLIIVWAVSGPLFGFSETWQLVVNTATTIITFLMVFVLQNSQNRDGEALQAKLDELIIAVGEADDRFVGAEQLSGSELKKLRATLLEQADEATQELKEREAEKTA
jgi:low affinity Fe/Cu permease